MDKRGVAGDLFEILLRQIPNIFNKRGVHENPEFQDKQNP